jgi:hypothetical protein
MSSQSAAELDRVALLKRIAFLENELEDLAMLHETTLEHANTLENDLIALVETLAKTAAGLEVGLFDPAMLRDLVDRPDELGQLGRAFQAMGNEVSARDRRLRMLRVVIPSGVALSAERNFDQLLETLVIEAQRLCNADGAVLYLLTEEATLRAVIIRYRSLGLVMGGTSGGAIILEPIPLYTKDGEPNDRNATAHVALHALRVNLANAYDSPGYNLAGIRELDARVGYHTQSLLALPLTGDDNQIIGVLQLMNARSDETGELIPFVVDDVVDTLVLLASAALSSYRREERLRRRIEELQILVDPELKAKEVDEITSTDYFARLSSDAQKLRKKR